MMAIDSQLTIMIRRTNYLSSPAPKSSFSLSRKRDSCTHSPPPSFNLWSPSQKARISFRYVVLRPSCMMIAQADSLQACLNAPEPPSGNENGVDGEQEEAPEETNHAQMQAPQANMPRGGGNIPQYMSPEQQQQMAYQQYMQSQQQGLGGQYPLPPQGMFLSSPIAIAVS